MFGDEFDENERDIAFGDDPYGDDPYGDEGESEWGMPDEPEWASKFREGVSPSEDVSELKASITAHERVSRLDPCTSGILMDLSGDMSNIQKRIREMVSVEDRFKYYVGAIINNLNENKILDISWDSRVKICQKADDIPNVKFLNPTAYILGYVATQGGKTMNKRDIKMVFRALDVLKDDSIREPDVIRYSRFWMGLPKF